MEALAKEREAIEYEKKKLEELLKMQEDQMHENHKRRSLEKKDTIAEELRKEMERMNEERVLIQEQKNHVQQLLEEQNRYFSTLRYI